MGSEGKFLASAVLVQQDFKMFTALIRVNYTPLLRSFQSGAEARNASSTKIHHSLSFKTSPFLNYLAVTETSIAANIGRALMIMQSNTSLLHQAF